ncbi:hypothetical protein B0H67DRAFT_642073 [Lasiosphaeris hirsuta]|uniref:PH domain-containing protein n=1 Tax=Lasiosphaeris hirsuta TaxID=260670 RepID=A0AA40B0Z6_9PEZI|nr:hypothetical protein B0H67DRAFT_642073 [Lasiosphaeris hirsuta]
MMATSIASDKPIAASNGGDGFDPFVTSPSGTTHLRHSNFDTQLFALSPGTSAGQVKRAIEAHLRDTERRMEEAGKLGTALVQQQRELTARLQEVEQLQTEGELNPDLRQRLVEIEKDYNEVARESARAFLPKQRIPSNEGAQGSPFAPEGKGGRRSVSPSKFESLATGSPTKLSVPNRKLRNQPANRIHDIEFAAEISTSLISQVRNLQAILAEREDELKDLKVDRSRLEQEAELFQTRMRTLDESENKYKDENWNLETQIRDMMTIQKELLDQQKKQQQTVNALQVEKTASQRELEEVKDSLAKQEEKHAATIKNLEIELGTSRRNAAIAESERTIMQRKVDELTSQNQELARAFSMQRGRAAERESAFGASDDEFQTATDHATPEHSPPPSPIKGTPRHSGLESETLKTSLGHAHRTIQTLRTNIHREKTEKLELKRMLQDARDELEKARAEPSNGSARRSRKADSREFRKPVKMGQLGGARSSKTELVLDEQDWEDQGDAYSPFAMSAAHSSLRLPAGIAPIVESSSDHFETANETSDAAFETAHERGTETEDFQTGAEEQSDDDDVATETEASPSKGSGRFKRPSVLPLNQASNRYSFVSTASTSNDEDESDFGELKTPTAQPSQKMRIGVKRGALTRRSRQVSEEPTFKSSPASFAVSSSSNTPQQQQPQQQQQQQQGQSLFAELGDFDGSDDDSYVGGVTPSRRSIRSVTPGSYARGRASPPPDVPALPRIIMVDSGMMTEPVDVKPVSDAPRMVDSGFASGSGYGDDEEHVDLAQSAVFHERPMSMESVIGPRRSRASTPWLGDEFRDGDFSRPLSSISYSDASAQHDTDIESKLAQFPAPPTSPPRFGLFPTPILPPPQTLTVSDIQSEHIEPREEAVVPPPLSISSILTEGTEPVPEPEVPAPALSISSLVFEHVEPKAEPQPDPIPLSMSTLLVEHVEPFAEPEPPLPVLPALSMVSLVSQHTEPVHEPEPAVPPPVALSLSTIQSEQIEPVELLPEPPAIAPVAALQAERKIDLASIPLSLASIKSEHVEPQHEPMASPARLSFAPISVAAEVEPREEPQRPLPRLSLSFIEAQHVEPLERPQPPLPALALSAIYAQDIEPLSPEEPRVVVPSLTISTIQSLDSKPIEPVLDIPAVVAPVLSVSAIQSLDSEPIEPVAQPAAALPLSISTIHTLSTEPVSARSPKRNAFIIPRDIENGAYAETEQPQTPTNVMRGWDAVVLSGDHDAAQTRKVPAPTSHQGAQTVLTAEAIDAILHAKTRPFEDPGLHRSTSLGSMGTPSTVRVHRPREASLDSPTRSKGKTVDTMTDLSDTTLRRPGSSASGRASIRGLPPLPANHKEVIEAARTGSSGGGQPAIGTMGPPMFPASVLKSQNAQLRPRTPNSARRPMSPISVTSSRGTPTPRAVRGGSVHGTADLQSPNRLTHHSRKSSVSSFASELETRFNIQNEGPFDAAGFGPNTDPRMIQAITQTMIGEHLWKYTRKTGGRGEMSGNRHRRYFWVHPYTRTLYWSDKDPSSAGRSELRAKSVAIEAVRVVTDDNPMPPGLHRKSLVIISPGRTVKFTCTTGQRHETWFNALSYLLLRTNDEGQSDAEEMAGNITREDVDEFNPTYGRRVPNGARAAASLSSYNSRTVRNNESPAFDMSLNIPTLTPTPRKKGSQNGRPSYGTFSRISGYWKDNKVLSGTLGSLRSRSASRSGREPVNRRIYEDVEVQDSAEDLRQIIERQDRESDRLENVRACCDGKHDVGTLTGSSKRGRHPRGHLHTHSNSGPSVASTPAGTVRSRA